jgi:hypothetical protein
MHRHSRAGGNPVLPLSVIPAQAGGPKNTLPQVPVSAHEMHWKGSQHRDIQGVTTMTVKPTVDHGQDLPQPAGRVMGFVDTEEQFQAVTEALKKAKYPESKIMVLHGEDGIHLLKRLKQHFQFSDAEDQMEGFALAELRAGHYVLAVEVENREDAMRVVNWTKPLGAHSFEYFGTWVNERLTK